MEMWPILLAELKKSVVENTKNSPLPILGGKKYTKPPETQTKRNRTTFSLLKKTTLETNALQEVLMYVFVTRLVEVILFWIPHKFYLHP